MPTIRFAHDGRLLKVVKGTSVLEAALANDVSIYHTCGGNCSCSTCRVRILTGAQNLTPVDTAEAEVLDSFDLKPPFRLGCQALILGDVEVEVPDREKAPRANKTPPVTGGPRGTY